MMTIYHQGEIQVQERAGARALAASMERTVFSTIAHKFVDFIQTQPFLVLASVGNRGRVWASMLYGEPGFLAVADEQTLRINALPDERDPLHDNLEEGGDIGLLLIDFATRRRLRVNGIAKLGTDGFSVQTRQVYANCPRYIQAREWEPVTQDDRPEPILQRLSSITEELQQWICKADTFFIASYHSDSGADVSHRGGFSGFVQVLDAQTLMWPEYNGNGMFNTLGNIVENPCIGLLFIDFDSGETLQLTGSATILWDEERVAAIPGAERLVEFKLNQALASSHAGMLRWNFLNYSPDNPWYC
jgi:hypothetical protein